MPLSFSFESFGEKQVERTLMGISTRSRDLRGAFQLIRRDFIKAEKAQFGSEGNTGSGGWAPLKAETIRAKVAKGKNNGVLRETNDMFKSMTVMSNPNNHYRATRDTLEMWTTDPKAIYHQKGTTKMPQRKVVDLTEANRTDWTKIIQAWVMAKEGQNAREGL